MSNIEIIRGVPLPPVRRAGGRKTKYPWDTMAVEDHFIFPEGVKPATASSLAYRAGKLSNKSFAIRIHEGKIKCWRKA